MALGTITSITNPMAEFEVEVVISGNSLPARIRFEVPDRYLSDTMDVGPNDFAVLSLDHEGDEYKIAHGIYQVSSLELETLAVLAGPLPPGDLASLQWYLNSGGIENDFYFIGTDAYERHSDGSATLVYPKTTQLSETEISIEHITKTPKPLVEEPLNFTATSIPTVLRKTPLATITEVEASSLTSTPTQNQTLTNRLFGSQD